MCGVICLCDVDVCVRARARRLFAREFLFFNDCHNIFECFGARAFFSNTSPTKWIFRILLIHGVYLWSTRQLIYVEWNNITDKTTQVIVKFLLSFIVLICFFSLFFLVNTRQMVMQKDRCTQQQTMFFKLINIYTTYFFKLLFIKWL